MVPVVNDFRSVFKTILHSQRAEFISTATVKVIIPIRDSHASAERFTTLRPDMAEQRGEDGMIAIDDIAETFWQRHHQGRAAWTFETELRPYKEAF